MVIFKIVYEKYNDFCLEWIWNKKEIKKKKKNFENIKEVGFVGMMVIFVFVKW